MGIIQNINKKINVRKLNKMKSEYAEKFEKNHKLASVETIQQFISSKNIPLLSEKAGYGDSMDSIEAIFSDNPKICEEIKTKREEHINFRIKNIIEDIRHDNSEKTFIECDNFVKFEDEIFNFSRYYDLSNEENKLTSDLKNDYEIVLQNAKKALGFVTKHSGLENSEKEKFTANIVSMMQSYSLYKLNTLDNFSQRQDVLIKAQEILNDIVKDVQDGKVSKVPIAELASEFGNDSTKEFISKIKLKSILLEQGMEVDIEKQDISFIDATDTRSVEVFYKGLALSKDEELRDKEYSVKDFAMVRTTEYFPKNREMETIDRLNSRIKIPNFLSYRLAEGKKSSDEYKTQSTMYRSTKHFTLNGLGSSHSYGDFSGNPFIIIDPLEEHIDDENLLNLNEADTYFTTSREKPFKLSDRANIVIPIDEYVKLKDNKEMMDEISQYPLTLFKGDEKAAIDIKLYSMGYIPENISSWGYSLTDKFSVKLDSALTKIADEHGIAMGTHYLSKIMEDDLRKTVEMNDKDNLEFVEYMFEKFGIDEKYKKGAIDCNLEDSQLENIIDLYGEENLTSAIKEFNKQKLKELDKEYNEYSAKMQPKKAKEENVEVKQYN